MSYFFFDSEGILCLSFLRFRGGLLSEVFKIHMGSYVLGF